MKSIKNKIFGRSKEDGVLKSLLKSNKPEFIAVYGRRRVGKTYFLRETLKSSGCSYFDISGQKKASRSLQLQNFTLAFQQKFSPEHALSTPKTWNEAFESVTKEIKKSKKTFIFLIDELPWLCGQKSGCYEALDYYWNKEWSLIPYFKLIVCGSAAAWMIEKIINAKGGLHNRITYSMLMQPFDLLQTKDYLIGQGFRYTTDQTIRIQMCFGGIPYYLSLLKPSLSDSQNIDQLFYSSDSPLFDEFEKIFESLFEHHRDHQRIVQILAKKRIGMNSSELLKATQMSSGGTFQKRLVELEKSGFIQSRVPLGRKKKETTFFLTDEYSFFYLAWIKDSKKIQSQLKQKNFWSQQFQKPEWYSWAGYCFESLVMKNFDWVQKQLHLDGLIKNMGPLRVKGAQIDLLLERTDGVAHIIEIKYHQNKFEITKEYSLQLKNKIHFVIQHYKEKKQILLSVVTLNGFKENNWSHGIVDSSVAIKDLLK